jgi:glycosyltransferase involved in cell wall biosynthesis
MKLKTRQVQHPLISVVMATYNGEKYLRDQLQSIFNQTYNNIEVIVCDDASTDKTVEILEEFRNTYGLVFQVNDSHLGLVRNFEKVMSQVRGDYIALSDQDDIWYPNKLEFLIKNIGSFSMIFSAVHVIDGNGNPHENPIVVSEYSRDHTEKVNFKDFIETAWVLGCTSLIKRDLLDKTLPMPDGVMFHDWWLTLAAIKMGNGIKYLHTPTIKYRQHGDNAAFRLFLDISWYRKRVEFYKLLLSFFHDELFQDEKEMLIKNIYDSSTRFILLGDRQGHQDLVEQFLKENPEFFTLPFVRELISVKV